MFVNHEDEESGVFAVSVVENPAIESSYVALKKEVVKLAEVDKKKQILMGALLIPEQRIVRFNKETNEPYKIYFSKETIAEVIKLYMKGSKQNNTTLEHEVELEGNTIMEIWQKEDMVHDKSAMYGIDEPIGTAMITMHVPDKDQYDNFVASKTGFSLEGNFTSQLELSKKVETMSDDQILDLLKQRIESEG